MTNIIKLLSKKYNFDEGEARNYIDNVKHTELKKICEDEEKQLREKYKNYVKEGLRPVHICDLEENELNYSFFGKNKIKIIPSYKTWKNNKNGRREF
jgi:hypothetical protein